MYSILKTQKRSIKHKKTVSITSSTFITNNHILLTYSDGICQVLVIRLGEQNTEKVIWESKTLGIVSESGRLSEGSCAMFCIQTLNIYVVSLLMNRSEGTETVHIELLPRGGFASMFNVINDRNELNGLGCQFRLHTGPECLILETQIYKDRKLIFDCFKQTKTQSSSEGITNNYELLTKEMDLETNGRYAIDVIYDRNMKIAVYKQEEIDDVEWIIRIYDPNAEKEQGNDANKEVRIILPNEYFNEGTIIRQVCEYVDGSYIVIVGNRNNGELKGYQLVIIDQGMFGTLANNSYHFVEIPRNKCEFLHSGFMSILYMNAKEGIVYVQCHVHERINGELYENCLLIGNVRTGMIMEKGYCTLKNIDFSPDYRLILDMPYEYENFGETYYHVRLLLSKNSLYMFIIHNLEDANGWSEGFKETVLSLF